MVSLFSEFGSIIFWPKTLDYSKVFRRIIPVFVITPHWKVLRSWNLCQSAPLEMLFPMVSLFSEFGSIIFWPKTLDYN